MYVSIIVTIMTIACNCFFLSVVHKESCYILQLMKCDYICIYTHMYNFYLQLYTKATIGNMNLKVFILKIIVTWGFLQDTKLSLLSK